MEPPEDTAAGAPDAAAPGAATTGARRAEEETAAGTQPQGGGAPAPGAPDPGLESPAPAPTGSVLPAAGGSQSAHAADEACGEDASASATATHAVTTHAATDVEPGAADPDEVGALGGIARLSLPSRLIVAAAVAAVAVGAVFHLGMVFLHVAPTNTLSQQHAQALDDYIYPEFEQNWKLFAPNPVQENDDAQARAEVRLPDGDLRTTGWVDLTAMDLAKIRHDPIPSHTVQNELRRALGFYTDSHDAQERPIGLRGALSQEYLLRIAAMRFGPDLNGGRVQRIQMRIATTPVGSPPWSAQTTDIHTSYRVLPWWAVSAEDFQ